MSDPTFPEYHKINGLYKRDEKGRFTEEFARPEFEYLYYNDWLLTEKVDGTNIRIGWDPDGMRTRIGGRTDNAQIPVHLLEPLDAVASALQDAVQEQLGEFVSDCPYVLYGEGYGARIQKGGGNYRSDCGFVLFDVRAGDWWLDRDAVEGVGALLGLDVVPIVAECTLEDAERLCHDGFDSSWGPFPAEGVVATPVVPLFARDRKRVITKVKTKDYAHAKADAVTEARRPTLTVINGDMAVELPLAA